MPYYFYILYSKTVDRYYSGSSENPQRRLTFHNSIEKDFTARFRPRGLVFAQEFPTKLAAQKAERKVKAWKITKMVEKLLRGEIILTCGCYPERSSRVMFEPYRSEAEIPAE